MEPLSYEKRGYLNEPFRLFHLADDRHEDIPYHYHSFHKLIFLLAGRAGYAIEGERYALQPGDYVLVGRGSIHRPVVERGDFYERVVLYISPEYLQRLSHEGCDLAHCFRQAQEDFRYVYRDDGRVREGLAALEAAAQDSGFGAALLRQAHFTRLMVEVDRTSLSGGSASAAGGDSKVVALLQYLNAHLSDPLSIDELAGRFYISKYHMMRRFHDETGYTIHGYITEKRLLLAQQLLAQGLPLSEVALRCGYQEYSTFSRAYKKKFGCSPSLDSTICK